MAAMTVESRAVQSAALKDNETAVNLAALKVENLVAKTDCPMAARKVCNLVVVTVVSLVA